MKAPQGGLCANKSCGKRYRRGQQVSIIPGNGSPLPRLCHPACLPQKRRVQPRVDGHQTLEREAG